MVFRTRVIVRLGTQNRMVTKGYRKGVYDRVTAGTHARPSDRNGDCRDVARYVSDFRQSHDFVYRIWLQPYRKCLGSTRASTAALSCSINKHRVVNQVRGRINPPIQLDLGHAHGLRKQAPEE